MPTIPGFLLGRRPSLASIQIIIGGLGQRYFALSVRVSHSRPKLPLKASGGTAELLRWSKAKATVAASKTQRLNNTCEIKHNYFLPLGCTFQRLWEYWVHSSRSSVYFFKSSLPYVPGLPKRDTFIKVFIHYLV